MSKFPCWGSGGSCWHPQHPARFFVQTENCSSSTNSWVICFFFFFFCSSIFTCYYCYYPPPTHTPFSFSTLVRNETCKSTLMKLISVSIGQKTQKVHICFIHFKSHVSHTSKEIHHAASKPFLHPHPTVSSLHWFLLYVIEIETSIKIGLLLSTKESDTLEWRILLWFKPLDLITLILYLYERNSISVSNYVQVGFAEFGKSYFIHLSACCVTLSNVFLTLLVFVFGFFIL